MPAQKQMLHTPFSILNSGLFLTDLNALATDLHLAGSVPA